jgi:predicted ATPase
MPDAGLPTYHTELVARDAEARAVLDRLAAGAALVTLTGPGGVGKTRLAAAVAAAAGPAFPDGVRFVSLESTRDARGLLLAIARALAVAQGAPDDLLREVRLFLADRRMLIVLDNFEQLIAHSGVLGDLLNGNPGLAVLVT